jgi:hypothetical protein
MRGETFGRDLLETEEFPEFTVSVSQKSIERSCNSDSETGKFWLSKPGRNLLDGDFLAPTKLDVSDNTLNLKQKLAVTSYPGEWTTHMLANAGQKLLDFLSSDQGSKLVLKESYSRNFQFYNGDPRWVDLGSFSNAEKPNSGGLYAIQELQLVKNYVIPIHLAMKGFQASQKGLLTANSLTSMEFREVTRLAPVASFRILGILPSRLGNKLILSMLGPLWINDIPEPVRNSVVLRHIFPIFVRTLFKPLLKLRMRGYRKLFARAMRAELNSSWAAYGGRIGLHTPRFDAVQNKLAQIEPDSILDIGGNKGYVGFRALKSTTVSNYTVLDWDENAVNFVNRRARDEHSEHANVQALHYNFLNPWIDGHSIPAPARLASETVVCLGLSHHLLLTGQMSPLRLWKSLHSLCKSDLLIEFMPKGMWSQGGKKYPPLSGTRRIIFFQVPVNSS